MCFLCFLSCYLCEVLHYGVKTGASSSPSALYQRVISAFHQRTVGSHYSAFSAGHIQPVLGTRSHCAVDLITLRIRSGHNGIVFACRPQSRALPRGFPQTQIRPINTLAWAVWSDCSDPQTNHHLCPVQMFSLNVPRYL